ncbi:hypothetical protein F66182_10126 [Fusarium sp. NRRL 66182]|nr:hypothetical protein F66182_10126 [Fusarium sp. NRRL 66182]
MDIVDKENIGSGQQSESKPRLAPLTTHHHHEKHARDTQAPHIPTAAASQAQNHATSTASGKRSKQSRRPRAAKQHGIQASDPKDFKERLVGYLLDNWKARAQVVYTNGQVDMTPLWSPQWAGIVACGEGMNLFDGHDRTWFVPFDTETPLPAGKQDIAEDLQKRYRELLNEYETNIGNAKMFRLNLVYLMEEEVEVNCRNQWDKNYHKPDEAPQQWSKVRHTYAFACLARMIARARLADGIAQLPGYCEAYVYDLATDGKIVYRRISLPTDADLSGIILRLDRWDAPHADQSQYVIETSRRRLNKISENGNDTQRQKVKTLLGQISVKFGEVEGAASERSCWIFKLRIGANPAIPAGRLPDEVKGWTRLNERNFQDLIGGFHAGKHPVFIRKVRLRRMWPDIDELERQLKSFDEPELAMMNAVLTRQPDQGVQPESQFS